MLHARAQFGRSRSGALVAKWSALHAAADAVASIAGLPPPEGVAIPGASPIGREGEIRRELVEQGIDDLTALVVPALSALLAAMARGARPRAAARTLLHEFVCARDALVVLFSSPVGTARG
jgi:hypothetical protein